VGVSIGDSIAGIYAAFGTVMALFQRQRAKVPLSQRVIDVALNEAVLSVMESLVPDCLAYGVTRHRVGGRMEGIAPSNAYPCADGTSIIVAGNGDAIFQRYMETIGRPDLAADPDLQTNAGRWHRRDELDAAIGKWSIRHDRDEALKILDEAGVPSGPIYTAADICADEQYAARNMIQHFEVDTGGAEPSDVGFPGIVPREWASVRDAAADRAGHLLGISNQQVDPGLALLLRHAERWSADCQRPQHISGRIEYRRGEPRG
jgi:formyl-CoA transferase